MPKPLRLSNPFAQIPSDDRIRLQVKVDPAIFNYLFKRILVDQGHVQAVLAILVAGLHKACVTARIGFTGDDPTTARWDDNTEQLVAELLLNLNFNPSTHDPVPPRTRRTNLPTPKHKGKPATK